MPCKAFYFLITFLVGLQIQTLRGQTAQKHNAADPMRLSINAKSMSRRLMQAELIIPIAATKNAHSIALWYPKWVPGSHGPGGPIANLAGLRIHGGSGERLNWKRTPGEVYRLEVEVPPGEDELQVSIRYVTDQPTTNSFGHDCFTSHNIGVINSSCLLLYPEGSDVDEQQIVVDLQIPDDWHVASALPHQPAGEDIDHRRSFDAVTLRTLVDSPIMLGRHYRMFELAASSEVCPTHKLHVFADDTNTANLNEEVVDRYRQMVEQTALLFGSHPFDRFDILLAVTNALPKNGLEHARSTFNVLPPDSLVSPKELKGWDRLLVPHEYLHAWCGKYRRPIGMLTSDFHRPKDTELLWVYEGLTQYLGEVIEARSGLMSDDEFRNRVFVELRQAIHQQGRKWRPLSDTAAASHILRDASSNWGGLRRSQDYYMEGMLFWLEADAHIRRMTEGNKSLDDFCKSFFLAERANKKPSPFTRDDIVKTLESVANYDWEGLISRRVESFQEQFDPAVADLLGYQFKLDPTKPNIPSNTFRHSRGIDLLDSLGIATTSDGVVRRVLLDSPADQALLAPTMEIIGVDGHKWSGERMVETVKKSSKGQPIKLLVAIGDRLSELQIHYYDGLRYWKLERDEQKPDLLAEIIQAKTPPNKN